MNILDKIKGNRFTVQKINKTKKAITPPMLYDFHINFA